MNDPSFLFYAIPSLVIFAGGLLTPMGFAFVGQPLFRDGMSAYDYFCAVLVFALLWPFGLFLAAVLFVGWCIGKVIGAAWGVK